MDYPLDQVEADIKPEDFPADSIWHELVKYCGPASVVILAKYREMKSEQLSLKSYARTIHNAQLRKLVKGSGPHGKN